MEEVTVLRDMTVIIDTTATIEIDMKTIMVAEAFLAPAEDVIVVMIIE